MSIEVSPVHRPVFSLKTLCLALVRLHDGLGFSCVASTSLLRALHHVILLDELSISGVRELLTLIRYLQFLGDDAHALVTIESGVLNLRLEGEVSDCGHIKVSHLEELRNGLHSVLEREHRVGCHVTEAPCQYSFFVCQIAF